MHDHLSQTFSALSDPTRRAMLAQLSKGDSNVSDLAKPFLKTMSLPAITKHLKVLETAGLVTKTRDAQWRSCKLNGTPLKDATDWIEQYRIFWEESFDRLGAYLQTVQKKKIKREEIIMAAKNESHELKLTRVYDAPVKLVWEAWTDPKKAAKWWGPRGFTITTHSKDLRPGGSWVYTMHGPDGTDYPNKTFYHEVEKHSRLVYDHGANDERPPMFRVTVTFEESLGKTTMQMTMAFPTPEIAKESKKFIRLAGGEATWDRLAEYLGDENGEEKFVINRSFETSIETMFKMWTDPTEIVKWLPPTGFTMTYKKADVRTGGTSVYSMTNGEVVMHGQIKYLEVKPVHQLVYTQEFIDERGNISRHPMMPVFPASMLTMVEFVAESSSSTRVTVTWKPYGEATAAEVENFRLAKPGMTLGWSGSFDKFESCVVTE